MGIPSHGYLQISMCTYSQVVTHKSKHTVFILKLTWSKVAATQVCFQVYGTPSLCKETPSHVSGLSSRFPLKQFKYVFSVARELHRTPSVFCLGLSHSYYVFSVTLTSFGFVVYIQRRPVVVSIPSVCVSSCGGLAPSLSSLLLAWSLDRK